MDSVVQRIMDELVRWQKAIAKEGSVKGGIPEKKINFDTVEKQINAKVPFTAIAASQKVSEGTLRRKLREDYM